MPQDAITISYLGKELKKRLNNAKITRITQPEKDEIFLNLYTENGRENLVLSANSNSPRCHLTSIQKTNPQTPPPFCMLLRKHLQGGTITDVRYVKGDRIIHFEITARNELFDNVKFVLAIELMSRQSNIILINENNRILGMNKPQSFDSMERKLFSGVFYELPSLNHRISPYNKDQLHKVLQDYTEGNVTNYLLDKVAGLAFSTVSEILFRAIGKTELFNLDDKQKKLIEEQFDIILNLDKHKLLSPCVSYKKGVPKEYYAIKYSYFDADVNYYKTINEAIEEYYSVKDTKQRISEHSKRLGQILKNAISRNEKKLFAQENQLSDSKNYKKDKTNGELITANIYKIKPGDESVLVNNYYEEDSPLIRINLDKQLSPSQNAQKCYNRYAKKKRTIQNITIQIAETRQMLDMLYQIQANLKNIDSIDDVELIKQDLINSKIMRKKKLKKGKKEKTQKLSPIHYVYDDFKIYVGRNSTENEYVTHKIGRNKDLFLHAKKNFGAHVIIKYQNRDLTDEVILFGAELAAYYSSHATGEKVEIDYTEVKNVKKAGNGKLGLVIYHTNWSMLAKPNKHEEYLKNK